MRTQHLCGFLAGIASLLAAVPDDSTSLSVLNSARADCEDPTDPRVTWQSQVALDGFAKTNKISIVAAAQMGAQGAKRPGMIFTDYPLPTLETECSKLSASGNEWFGQCTPLGIKQMLWSLQTQNWLEVIKVDGGGSGARGKVANLMAYFMGEHSTPILVPLFGRGDHWVTVWTMKGTLDPRTNKPSEVCNVRLNDAVDGEDGAKNIARTRDWMTGGKFIDEYMSILTAVGPNCPTPCVPPGPCAPCTDPYLGQFVFLYDPPVGAPVRSESEVPEVRFQRAPGLTTGGVRITADAAAKQVVRAIELAGLHRDPEIADILRRGVVGEPYPVVARFPEGEPRRFIAVPIVDADPKTQQALAFIRLDADDGAFQSFSMVNPGFVYRPVSAQAAADAARGLLRSGESLSSPGVLHWASEELHPAARKLWQAFYEFPIEQSSATTAEVIRVARNGGTVLGRAWVRSVAQ